MRPPLSSPGELITGAFSRAATATPHWPAFQYCITVSRLFLIFLNFLSRSFFLVVTARDGAESSPDTRKYRSTVADHVLKIIKCSDHSWRNPPPFFLPLFLKPRSWLLCLSRWRIFARWMRREKGEGGAAALNVLSPRQSTEDWAKIELPPWPGNPPPPHAHTHTYARTEHGSVYARNRRDGGGEGGRWFGVGCPGAGLVSWWFVWPKKER